MTKVAIVGSEEKHWTTDQRRNAVKKIVEVLHSHGWCDGGYGPEWNYSDIILVSGGCPKGGVDIWAEIVADVYGIQKEIHYPEVNQWDDLNIEYASGEGWVQEEVHKKGYATRNIEIAKSCDVLYCIDPSDRKWSGGRWTLNYAKSLGKKTELIRVE